MNRQFTQVVIAGTDFDPRVRDANEWLGKVFVLETCGAQHRTRRGAMSAIGKRGTSWLE
jgi:hypothetical protein